MSLFNYTLSSHFKVSLLMIAGMCNIKTTSLFIFQCYQWCIWKYVFVLIRNRVPDLSHPCFIYSVLIGKNIYGTPTVCRVNVQREHITGCFRYSFKAFRTEEDIAITISVGTFMTRQVFLGAPGLIRHYIQVSFHSWKDIHF